MRGKKEEKKREGKRGEKERRKNKKRKERERRESKRTSSGRLRRSLSIPSKLETGNNDPIGEFLRTTIFLKKEEEKK